MELVKFDGLLAHLPYEERWQLVEDLTTNYNRYLFMSDYDMGQLISRLHWAECKLRSHVNTPDDYDLLQRMRAGIDRIRQTQISRRWVEEVNGI